VPREQKPSSGSKKTGTPAPPAFSTAETARARARVVPFALELELQRREVAADGGDGFGPSASELAELGAPAIDVEWMLNGALLEAMAAVVLRAPPHDGDGSRSLKIPPEWPV